MKRTGKFYRLNEKEVMKRLGLNPTKGSGSGWIEKGDGQNEKVVCELKSTDSNSYRVNLLDLNKIENHALVAHKVPVFAIQFLQSDELFLVIKTEYIEDVLRALENKPNITQRDIIDDIQNVSSKPTDVIKSSSKDRDFFKNEQANKYKKEKSAK